VGREAKGRVPLSIEGWSPSEKELSVILGKRPFQPSRRTKIAFFLKRGETISFGDGDGRGRKKGAGKDFV